MFQSFSQRYREQWQIGLRIGLLAAGLSILKVTEFVLGQNLIEVARTATIPISMWVELAVMMVAFSAAVIGAFTLLIRSEGDRIAATISVGVFALLTGIHAAQTVNPLMPVVFHSVDFLAQTVLTGSICYLLTKCLKIAGPLQKWPPILATIAVSIVGIIAISIQGWTPLPLTSKWVHLTRDLMTILVPTGILAVTTLIPSFRLDQKSAINSARLRLPAHRSHWQITLYLIVGGAIVSAGYHTGHLFSSSGLGIGATTFSILGVIYFCTATLIDQIMRQQHGSISGRLTASQAKRFLKRHVKGRKNWAATVGLKTANYTIDHDPGGFLHQNLPASLMQIRSEEIQRCVNLVLNQESLHFQAMGHRMFGAIDSESTLRPCVTVLKLFAALYLDASPLVERRIKGLTQLLPIIDPDLAKLVNANEINHLIRRNQWFFYFDFNWIDQHIIHTQNSTQYNVMLSTLSSKSRDTMLNYLDKKSAAGNVIWMGPEARHRLMQEAHVLKNIIDTCPIPSEDGSDEQLMFAIKFETLIPRLQRYFNLDRMRKTLLDFDPSPENERLFSLLGLQVARATTPTAIKEVLKSIESIPWRGFREKDSALQLIVKVHQNVLTNISKDEPLHSSESQELRSLHEDILGTVKKVGYPAQMLHNAQINKLALRDIDNLFAVAMKPWQDRFHEAWQLLSTYDFSRVPDHKRSEIVNFIIKSCDKNGLYNRRLVQSKAIDTLTNIGKQLNESDRVQVTEAINVIGRTLVLYNALPDIHCLLLDAQAYLCHTVHESVTFDSSTIGQLDGYFNSLQDDLGMNHPDVIAIMSRWQEFRVQSSSSAA